jgi:glutamate synthase (NADPH/NADH) small chain
MANPQGFLNGTRELPGKEAPESRVKHYREFTKDEEFGDKIVDQASRCMDCGVPFCHNGCPLGNIIPEFNDAVYRKSWDQAWEILNSTNNFPEFTGRICPAPCETACVLGINQPAITIENIEKNIVEHAYKNGLVTPKIPKKRSGQKVAVIGGGPAGLAAAEQLNSAGHSVTVFERAEHVGGLVRYGIPDFKLEKWVVERKVELMESAGIEFKTKAHVGVNVDVADLKENFDAIALTGGSTKPRNLPAAGREEAKGVHFAMDFLSQNNSRVAGKKVLRDHCGEECAEELLATDKNVIVIGGGDTGSDCVGTSNRHGAKSVTQFEIMPKPPEDRADNTPWPEWPMMLRTSSSHEEGVAREWCVTTKKFVADENGNLKSLIVADVEWVKVDGRMSPKEVEGSERELPCELALLAMGFLHPEHDGMLNQLGVDYDERGNVHANNFRTSVDTVFAAGDMRRGQSLVVWAIHEGRECAVAIDEFLTGAEKSKLESKADTLMKL